MSATDLMGATILATESLGSTTAAMAMMAMMAMANGPRNPFALMRADKACHSVPSVGRRGPGVVRLPEVTSGDHAFVQLRPGKLLITERQRQGNPLLLNCLKLTKIHIPVFVLMFRSTPMEVYSTSSSMAELSSAPWFRFSGRSDIDHILQMAASQESLVDKLH